MILNLNYMPKATIAKKELRLKVAEEILKSTYFVNSKKLHNVLSQMVGKTVNYDDAVKLLNEFCDIVTISDGFEYFDGHFATIVALDCSGREISLTSEHVEVLYAKIELDHIGKRNQNSILTLFYNCEEKAWVLSNFGMYLALHYS